MVRWREGRRGERRVEGEENNRSGVRVGEKELNENYEQELTSLVPRPHPVHILQCILEAFRVGVGFGFGTETRN